MQGCSEEIRDYDNKGWLLVIRFVLNNIVEDFLELSRRNPLLSNIHTAFSSYSFIYPLGHIMNLS